MIIGVQLGQEENPSEFYWVKVTYREDATQFEPLESIDGGRIVLATPTYVDNVSTTRGLDQATARRLARAYVRQMEGLPPD